MPYALSALRPFHYFPLFYCRRPQWRGDWLAVLTGTPTGKPPVFYRQTACAASALCRHFAETTAGFFWLLKPVAAPYPSVIYGRAERVQVHIRLL